MSRFAGCSDRSLSSRQSASGSCRCCIAASDDPTLAAYRDEILFDQTIHALRQRLASSRAVLVFPGRGHSSVVVAAHAARAVAVRPLARCIAFVRLAHRVACVVDRAGRAVLQLQHRQARRVRAPGGAGVGAALRSIPRAGRGTAWRATRDVRLAAVASGLCAATWIYLLVRPDRARRRRRERTTSTHSGRSS